MSSNPYQPPEGNSLSAGTELRFGDVVVAAACCVLVPLIFYTGGYSVFTLWGFVPVILTCAFYARARRRHVNAKPELAFALGACGLTLAVHLAWIFDWGETKTGSSTSALIFLFIPIYATILGCVCFGVVRVFVTRRPRE